MFVTKRREDSYSFYDFDNQDEVLGMLRLARGAENVKHYLITPDTTLEEQIDVFLNGVKTLVCQGGGVGFSSFFLAKDSHLIIWPSFIEPRNVSQCERMLMSLNASTTICVFVFSNVNPPAVAVVIVCHRFVAVAGAHKRLIIRNSYKRSGKRSLSSRTSSPSWSVATYGTNFRQFHSKPPTRRNATEVSLISHRV